MVQQLSDVPEEIDPIPPVRVLPSPADGSEVARAMARELHDTVIQALSLLVLEMERHKVTWGRSDRRQTADMERLQELVREVLINLRATVHDLRGEGPGDVAVARAIRAMLRRLERDSGIKASLTAAPSWPATIADHLSRNVIRVVEEALHNVRWHSGADQVTVSLWTAGGKAMVSVEDNGRGYRSGPAARGARGALGVLGMHERALLIGGVIRIDSRPGGGTRVLLKFPLAATG